MYKRQTLEYAAPTFHPMLNLELRDQIESIQKRASKLIFGWNSNYDQLVKDGKLKTLEERRETLTKNFAVKTSKNVRFANWFKPQKDININLRSRNKYEEEFARTERMKKSPVYYMRRILNAN